MYCCAVRSKLLWSVIILRFLWWNYTTCYAGPLYWKSKKTECGEESVFRGLSAKRPLMRLWRRMTSRIGSFALFFIVYTTVVFHFHFCARFDKEFEQSNAETMTRRNRGPPPIFYPRVVFLHHFPLPAHHKSIPEILSCQLVFLKRPACTLNKRRNQKRHFSTREFLYSFDLSKNTMCTYLLPKIKCKLCR